MHSIKDLLLIAMLFTLGACSKDDGPAAPLEGVWQWVRSDGGLGNTIHDTPASTGRNITLKLMDGGRYAVYINGVLDAEGTYTLETRTCMHDELPKTVINFPERGDAMIHVLDAHRLELSDEVPDGLGSLYHRAEVSIYK